MLKFYGLEKSLLRDATETGILVRVICKDGSCGSIEGGALYDFIRTCIIIFNSSSQSKKCVTVRKIG